ncbi:MAG: OmpA family protein [Pseudomonadota bacterium]
MKLSSSLMIAASTLVLVACGQQAVEEAAAPATTTAVAQETGAAPAQPAAAPEEVMVACDAAGRDVLFDVDSAAFNDISLSVAQGLADIYFDCEASSTTISGGASTTGSAAHNLALSGERAEAVAGVFRGAGVPGAAITTVARGEERAFLKVKTGDDVENVLNRRVAVEYSK